MIKTAGIYKITCTANGRVYIGQSTDIYERMKDHKRRLETGTHYNAKLQRAWDKYGSGFFVADVVEVCRSDFDVLNEREVCWIKRTNALDKNLGFNTASGGGNGYSLAGMTDEERAEVFHKISVWRKEYYKTHDAPFKGHKWSEVDKQRIREFVSGSNGVWYGKKRPDHSKAMTGGGNPRARPVHCITTGKVFACAKDAEHAYGVTNSMILKCCKGVHKTGGKMPDGTRLVWAYKEAV